ncbi:MAG: exodeoxyribonuclease VII large subunit [bacterium]|nr:exodeoxyribonuclease VII large subunit [bacterium]
MSARGLVSKEVSQLGATYTVAELVGRIKAVLTSEFAEELWVQGEVRNLKVARSGHAYFDIIETSEVSHASRQPEALIAVALFRRERDKVDRTLQHSGGMALEDGMKVRICGRVDFYAAAGRLQFYMSQIDPNFTLGQLESDRLALLQALSQQGLLDRNRSLAFPVAPLRIGLVTSAGSAAQRDFCHELEGSGLAWEVLLAHTLVQGADAPPLIAAAIDAVIDAGVDVVAVVRGGGSRTDLAAFDYEAVARAITTAAVPVVTGIGHEIDRTIADEVAYEAQKTPTACAAFVVNVARAHISSAEAAWDGIANASAAHLRACGEHLATVSQTTVRAGELRLRVATDQLIRCGAHIRYLAENRTRTDTRKVDRLAQVMQHRAVTIVGDARRSLLQMQQTASSRALRACATAAKDLDHVEGRVELLDPSAILARGWSITRHNGRVVRNLKELQQGDELETTLAEGKLRSTVSESTQAGQSTRS